MIKKQYFYGLWTLTSVSTVVQAVIVFLLGAVPISEAEPVELRSSAAVMMLVVIAMLGVFTNGFVIAGGLDFAQKIGARLLFLDGQFDFKEDILKPATVVGIVYAGVYLLAHVLLIKFTGIHFPWLYLFSNPEANRFLLIFNVIFMNIFETINGDIWLLLFGVSGIALLVKKIIKDISTSWAMLVGILLCSFLSGFHVVWKYGISVHAIVPSVEAIGWTVLLGLLFWKKGFETAVFCHMIIATILYLIAPAVVLVLGA